MASPKIEFELWAKIQWTAWGAIIATAVLWFERNLLAALPWLIVGIAIGFNLTWLIDRPSSLAFAWYERFSRDDVREHRMSEIIYRFMESNEYLRMTQPGTNDDHLLEHLMSQSPDAKEYQRLSKESGFGMLLSMPPFIGLYHGAFFGGIAGALCPLDPHISLPAWQGAALGIILGQLFVAFLAAVMCAAMISMTWSRRALMLISPLLALPVAWHCLMNLFRRSRNLG